MRKNAIKTLLITGEMLSVLGLITVVGIYPSKGWNSTLEYLKFIISNNTNNLWKVGIICVFIGLVILGVMRFINYKKVILFNLLAYFIGFTGALIEVNRLIPSAIVFLFYGTVLLFILAIVYTIKLE
ncbi:MAG: hypothetical protein U9N10_01285 [Bacillota bacterium]|nr:hypothetical protein [Bacillota bacterium]